MRLLRLAEVMQISGVPVYVHWSVLVIGGLALLWSLARPWEVLTALGSYLALLLVHECGHMVVARRVGCRVFRIELYPIHGRVHFSEPWSRYDDALIAWGGVAAQAIVAAPLVAWASAFGFTAFGPVNVVIGILGYYSIAVAALNLLPARMLDGARAWFLIPELVRRGKRPPAKPRVGWRRW